MLFWVVVASTAYGAYVTYGNAADVVRQISNAKASSDTAMSLALFRGVSQEPYLWDRSALAYSYVDRLTDADQSVDAAQLNSGLDNAIPVLQRAITEAPDDPLLSLKLASLYSQKHALDGSAPDPNWGLAIHHAMDFAPNWIEPLNYLAEYEAACKHYDQATRLANQAVDLLPENPEVRWSQASVYRLLDQEDVAAETAWQALQIGYRIRSAKEGIWLSDYYSERRNYDRVVEVYRMAIKARPNDIGLYRKLVDTYVDLGAKQKAVAIAIQASKVDPSNQEWRAFVQRLQ
jgi:tetratricopeptide (TPR) repeat protein